MASETLKSVLLLGGAGYIGSVLTRQLLESGYRVKVVDNFLFGTSGLDGLEHPNLSVIEADICNVKSLSKSCEQVDTVILLAAIVGRRIDDIQRATMRDINLLASSVAVDAAIEHGVERFIFASSDSVYGTTRGLVYETAVPEPRTLYSRLKLRMEERIINAKRRDFHPTVLRIGSCYGYSPRMRFDLPANKIIRDAVLNRKISLPSGDEQRAFIHVADACEAVSRCLSGHLNMVSGETFNVCASGQNYSMQDIANEVAAVVPEVKINLGSISPGVEDYKLSDSKIGKLLDFSPKWNLERGIEELKGALEEEKFPDSWSLQFNNN